MKREFIKMTGIGNDFVVFDGRGQDITLTSHQARYIADRHFGIGCDQILVIAPSTQADIMMHILNSDGSEASACGNGSRCVADLVMAEDNKKHLTIETLGGIITAERVGKNIAVDMGIPRFDWQDIPLAEPADTASLDLGIKGLPPAIAVNMGNPHAVHIIENADEVDLSQLGPQLEYHPLFPNRANIEFISLMAKDEIRMRVWERGSGITIACGSGACASAVAAARAGITGRHVKVHLDGGILDIEWRADESVTMAGASKNVFEGVIDLSEVENFEARS